MRPILIGLAMLCLASNLHAQYVYTIKADSVKITNHCDTAELIIENHTQNVLGFLYNKGRGRTEFRKVERIDDSTLLFGEDTLYIRGKITSASNGASLFATDVRLGQTEGDPENPAMLTENREIPMQWYQIRFTNVENGYSGYIGSDGVGFSNEHTWINEETEIGYTGSGLSSHSLNFNSQGYGDGFYSRNGFSIQTSEGRQIRGNVGDETRLSIMDQAGGNPTIWLGLDTLNHDALIYNDHGTIRMQSPTVTEYQPPTLNVSLKMHRVGIMNPYPEYSLDVTGSGNFTDSVLVGSLPAGTSSNDLVVWDASSKVLKKVPQAGIGNAINRHTVNDANYTATSANYLVAYIAISTGRTVTLPAASTMTNKTLIIKDESGSAATHNITIDGFGSETIDGSANKVINSNFGSITIYSNGSYWFTIHQ